MRQFDVFVCLFVVLFIVAASRYVAMYPKANSCHSDLSN